MESHYAQQLLDIVLSWNYWELEAKLTAGKGPILELPTIPKQFGTPEVHAPDPRLSCQLAAGSWRTWRAPLIERISAGCAGAAACPLVVVGGT